MKRHKLRVPCPALGTLRQSRGDLLVRYSIKKVNHCKYALAEQQVFWGICFYSKSLKIVQPL